MNRSIFLKNIGFNYPADFYDVQEVITIRNNNPDESNLLFKIENGYSNIKLELRYQTEEVSSSIFSANINVDSNNELSLQQVNILNSKEKNITNIDDLASILLQIIQAKCYNENCIKNTEISI